MDKKVMSCEEQSKKVRAHFVQIAKDSESLTTRLMAAAGLSMSDLGGVSKLTDDQVLLIRDAMKLTSSTADMINEMYDLQTAEAAKLDAIEAGIAEINKKIGTTKTK